MLENYRPDLPNFIPNLNIYKTSKIICFKLETLYINTSSNEIFDIIHKMNKIFNSFGSGLWTKYIINYISM